MRNVASKDVTGDLVLTCDTVVTKSRIAGRVIANGHALTAADTTIGPDACPKTGNANQLVTGGDFTLTRVHLQHSGSDLVRFTGGGQQRIVDSLLDGACIYPGDHLDVAQLYDPGAKLDASIVHSTLDARATNSTDSTDKGNAAIFLADNPGAGTFTITGNRLAGGNYATALYDATKGSGVTYRVTDNTYVRGSWQFGPCASTDSLQSNGAEGPVFTSNRYDDGVPLLTC
ncbi:hypothetical protein KRR39_01905 [Nocardioides panacis]|uniref:Right-handed parallel beta-helix repeat-containing protein n=1 Tax=Nocardioides panacis TaxID=2849501 RepID=A0A975SZ69_9ACTN|nr:hypothetical protein [Nocardioides panacis]QWZ08642.1 hypothetical protein KRR39_01905 [Nocardioides panacis]